MKLLGIFLGFFILVLLILGISSVLSLTAAEEALGDGSSFPPVSNDGRPWHIGYLEGGFYQDYPHYLQAMMYAPIRCLHVWCSLEPVWPVDWSTILTTC